MTGGGSNSPVLTPSYRSCNLAQHCVSPVAAIFRTQPNAQILEMILPRFQKNSAFRGDFNFIGVSPRQAKTTPKQGILRQKTVSLSREQTTL